MNNCCFNGTLKGVKQINTVSGRATKVKNKAIKIAGEIISMSCKGKHNSPNKKKSKIYIICEYYQKNELKMFSFLVYYFLILFQINKHLKNHYHSLH